MSGSPGAKRLAIVRNLFELAVASVWFIVGLAYLLDGHAVVLASPIGRYVGAWQYAWAGMFIVAAPGVWYGIVSRKPWHEGAGLLVLATGLVMQGFAAATYHPDPRAINYFIFASAALARAFFMLRGKINV